MRSWIDVIIHKDITPPVYYTPSGEEYRKQYVCGKENGCVIPIENGGYNIAEFINSFNDSCDLKQAVSTFSLVNGCDPWTFFAQTGKPIGTLPLQYGDISNIPDNRIDFCNHIKYGQSWFDSLPYEFREKFNFDLSVFLDKLGTAEFDSILQSFANPVEPPVDEPPVVNPNDVLDNGGAL